MTLRPLDIGSVTVAEASLTQEHVVNDLRVVVNKFRWYVRFIKSNPTL